MPDIAMCQRHDCGKKTSCYRYTAVPDEFYQTYVLIEDKDVSNGCDMIWIK